MLSNSWLGHQFRVGLGWLKRLEGWLGLAWSLGDNLFAEKWF